MTRYFSLLSSIDFCVDYGSYIFFFVVAQCTNSNDFISIHSWFLIEMSPVRLCWGKCTLFEKKVIFNVVSFSAILILPHFKPLDNHGSCCPRLTVAEDTKYKEWAEKIKSWRNQTPCTAPGYGFSLALVLGNKWLPRVLTLVA